MIVPLVAQLVVAKVLLLTTAPIQVVEVPVSAAPPFVLPQVVVRQLVKNIPLAGMVLEAVEEAAKPINHLGAPAIRSVLVLLARTFAVNTGR